MKEEINKAINDFSKGNRELAKILALFSAQMITIVGKYGVSQMKRQTEEMLEVCSSLISYFDINQKS